MEETIAVQQRHPAMQERQFGDDGDDGDGDDSDDGDHGDHSDDNEIVLFFSVTPFNDGIITGRL